MSRRVGYLGPSGTFTEEAARAYDGSARLLAFPTVTQVVEAVEAGLADQGVVALENSIEGAVTEVLDVLLHRTSLHICAELLLPVSHCLLVRAGTRPEDVKVICSHPQGLAQCRRYLERHFGRARLEAAHSTALALAQALTVEGAAAIGTRRAAELYGAEVLAEGIQDEASNVTRFVVVAEEDSPPTGDDKTSIAFSVPHDRPGSLVEALVEFSRRSINLTRIESRPSRESLGRYIFLVDLQGHRQDPLVAEALAQVQAKSSLFKLFGSYPRYAEGA